MDIVAIKQHIIDNPDTIVSLLESAEFEKIKVAHHEIRCARDEYTNPTSIKVNTNTLSSVDFGKTIKGDIFTLLGDKLNLDFYNTLQWVVKLLGLSEEMFVKKQITLPFGGYFKGIGKNSETKHESVTHPPILLDQYKSPPNLRFYKDGISFQSQDKFNIGYDSYSKRITIPWFNSMGELIGIMGRLNKDELEEGELKYLPVIPFRKDNVLFGYNINYNSILQKDICIVVEAEKGVLQLDSMGLDIGIGLGGNSVTTARERLIKGLGVNTIILAFDEGLDLELIKESAKKLKSDNMFFKNKVGYIYDPNGDIMPIGSKCSPTDLGIGKFKELMKEYVIWV